MMNNSRALARNVVVILLTVLTILLACYLVYRLTAVIGWIIGAIFLAVAIDPAVSALQRRHVPRNWAIATVLLVLLGAVLAIGALALPSLASQLRGIISVLGQPDGFTNEVMKVAAPLGLGAFVQTVRVQIDALPGQIVSAVGSFTSVSARAVNLVTAAITVIVLMIFFLSGGSRMVAAGVSLFPQADQPRLRRLLDQSGRAVSGYVTGNLTISLIAGTGAFIGMTVLGVPYALALGLLLALFDLIPMVGATLGAIPPIVAAFAISPIKALILLAYIIVYQQIESQVLNPLVYGRSVHLPGIVVFLSVLIGGTLFGFIGALIAIPVAEILRLVLKEALARRTPNAASPAPAVPAAFSR